MKLKGNNDALTNKGGDEMDREKVISELDTQIRWIEDIDAHKFPGWCGATMAMRYAMMLLKEQEAKTGKWIEQEDYNLDTYYDCSMCGNSWSTVEGTPWENGMNYCPHCGARMESIIYADGERKDSNE